MAALSQKYVRGFDGLRAIAVTGVMLGHLKFAQFSLGWIGVPLFFVLSGFLITGILLDSRGNENYLRRFYGRRAVRIWPIYYLLLSVALGVGIQRHWQVFDFPLLATFTDNWKLSFFGPASFRVGFPPFLNHLWSLAVEEQFYLLWPLTIMFLSKRAFACLVGALIVAGPLFRWLIAPHALEPGWACPADLLAWGSAGTLLIRKGVSLDKRPLLVAVLVLGATSFAMAHHSLLFVTLLGPTFLGILLLVHGSAYGLVPILEWKPMRYVGRISYGLYLYHPPVFYFYNAFAGSHTPVDSPMRNAVIPIGLAIAVASLSYRFIEQPLLNMRTAPVPAAQDVAT